MRRSTIACLCLAGAMAAPAWAQWSPVVSDANENTASGTQALLNLNASASGNTAAGYRALYANVSGSNNSALGALALLNLASGSDNSAVGYGALSGSASATGHGTFARNTAAGSQAVASIVSGQSNTGLGYQSLYTNTTGNNNTAVGNGTLYSAVAASYNTAAGFDAMAGMVSGGENTAVGAYSLQLNSTGSLNAVFGYQSSNRNLSGGRNAMCGAQDFFYSGAGVNNTAIGFAVGFSGAAGDSNVGVGYETLFSAAAASSNIGLGSNAGRYVTGSNNIDVGSYGVAADNGVIRFGSASTLVASGPSISAVYVAGVATTQLIGSALFVSSAGQLGTLASAQRYKVDIRTLADQASRLDRLRPVVFHLKNEPDGALQYGLIAEEVDQVYPELVTRDAMGRADGVRYDELTPLLLTEMTRLAATHRRLRDEFEQARRENAELQTLLRRGL